MFHCDNIAKANVWLIYRRHFEQLYFPSKDILSLWQFSGQFAEPLQLIIDRDPEWGPGLLKYLNVDRKPVIPTPIPNIWYDEVTY